ncbi:N-acetylmuramic acid 6-phosphate etherase [Radiobacillus kanasensis]|uniref:N-acetylmuramic acid 6-phosphate etherase n=1 Tax=Radiobacillus kanasensis TaxID=2844358 RepID=UPI001E5B15C7|nr:N-acetylmuramic acid 6-phosphate etherase [Radiobacillus kanasensis]UFU00796.1 N-acetylmuramic acid 6-phosphate etherase [Radiobacillus kanasensis]
MSKRRVTETVNQKSISIDEMSSPDIVSLMVEEDKAIYHGMNNIISQIAAGIDIIVEQWKKDGRVFVVGAGTSGRIGILDAAELGPTFSIPDERWTGFIAGGYEAMWKPLEQHEDDENKSVEELKEHSFSNKDVLIGLTASGTTPYVLTALKYANKLGARTISVSCNPQTDASSLSECAIEAVVGPEVIKGSTRLKAGTAQKMVINMLSTGAMIRLGKVYQNQMVDMQLINKKLVIRAEQTLAEVTDIPESEARILLQESDYDLKVAIFRSMTSSSVEEAKALLLEENGHLKNAIQRYFTKKGIGE